jgi:flagellar biosynthetic protein FliR
LSVFAAVILSAAVHIDVEPTQCHSAHTALTQNWKWTWRSKVLPADILTYSLVFARVGALVTTLPAIGEAIIPPRARLMLALALTLVMVPVVGGSYPTAAAATPGMLTGLIVSETVIGLAIGMILRMVMSAVQVAGNVIATQTGLAFAQTFDASQGTQSVFRNWRSR